MHFYRKFKGNHLILDRMRNPTVSPFLRQVKVDHKIKDLQLKKGNYYKIILKVGLYKWETF